ncbi:MAG: PilZ domain-containing protein [Pseudobdellovibrionaceae bacterium]
MNRNATDIFSKLSAEEGLRLFKDLANIRGEIICKGDGKDVFRLTLERAPGKQELHCSVPFGLPRPQKESDILGNFFIGGERYFFKTSLRNEGNTVILQMAEVFHLQRRQNYRIKIPDNYQANLLVSRHNNAKVKLKGQLRDLSCGGCRAVFSGEDPLFEKGDVIAGELLIKNREPLEIEGILRYHKLEKNIAKSRQIFGVEFKLSPLFEGKLYAITMDLHREFFSKYSKIA